MRVQSFSMLFWTRNSRFDGFQAEIQAVSPFSFSISHSSCAS